MRLFSVAVMTICMLASAIVSIPATGGLAQDNPECAGAEGYVRQTRTLQMRFEQQMGDLDTGDIVSWSPEDFMAAKAAAVALIDGLERITPPPAAEPVHASLIESFTIWSDLLDAVPQSGIAAALPLVESFNEVSAAIDANGVAFEETCQVALIDNDDDGTPEIGPGVAVAVFSGTPDPSFPVGSIENPVPVGERMSVGGGWEITVLDVMPDATDVVLAENSFNSPPEEGRQYFMATVAVANVSQSPMSFDGNFRLRAQSPTDTYEPFSDRCGVTPNEWEDVQIAPGEEAVHTVCWSVRSDEVRVLTLFDVDAVTETRVFFSLTPGLPGTPTPIS